MQLSELIADQYIEEVAELITNTDQSSVFEDYEDFKIFILRRVQFKGQQFHFVPEAFLILNNSVYYYNRGTASFEEIAGAYAGLLQRLEEYYRNNQKILLGYDNEVEKLEDYLFERSLPTYFMDLWFDVKKELSRMENYYHRHAIVYREFFKVCHHEFDFFEDDFKDIEENIHFQLSNIDSMKTRLDGVYSYHDSIKTDRLNKTLLGLTVISGIFLPLNLIVGFFGMNTPGLYFIDDNEGTKKVLIILVAVLMTFLLGFKLVQLADKYLLRYLLGRYSFYKNLSSSIEDMSSRFRGK